MGLGKQIRLKRLFRHPSGRLCSVAVDHFFNYATDRLPEGIRNLPAVLRAVVAGEPDAVTLHRGAALACWGPHAGRVPLIVQCRLIRPDDTADEDLAAPEDAVRMGADAFATCAYVRGPRESVYLRRVADAVREADRWDLPVVVHIYPVRRNPDRPPEISWDAEEVAWAVRCALECGADVIKTPFTGDPESFRQIQAVTPVPVVAAGGPAAPTLRDALRIAAQVVDSGARGMTVGRNVWSHGDPTLAVRALRWVLHEECEPEEAVRRVARTPVAENQEGRRPCGERDGL